MSEYRVYITRTIHTTAIIDADSEEEVKEIVESGDYYHFEENDELVYEEVREIEKIEYDNTLPSEFIITQKNLTYLDPDIEENIIHDIENFIANHFNCCVKNYTYTLNTETVRDGIGIYDVIKSINVQNVEWDID